MRETFSISYRNNAFSVTFVSRNHPELMIEISYKSLSVQAVV